MKRNTISTYRRKGLSSLAVAAVFFVTVIACHEDDGPTPSGQGDEPTQELLASLESIPATAGVSFETMVFEDGTSIKEYMEKRLPGTLQQFPQGRTHANEDIDRVLTDLIATMTSVGNNLMKRKLYQYVDEGPTKPAQNGLAYCYGSDSFSKRNTTKSGPLKGLEYVYGLDCSGMLSFVLGKCGLTVPASSDELSNPETWNKAFDNTSAYANLEMKAVKVSDVKNWIPGDIISWTGHIGFVGVDNNGNRILMQSNGDRCKNCTKEAEFKKELEKNRGTGRGPRALNFSEATSTAYWGTTYKVLRMVGSNDTKYNLTAPASIPFKNKLCSGITSNSLLKISFAQFSYNPKKTWVRFKIVGEIRNTGLPQSCKTDELKIFVLRDSVLVGNQGIPAKNCFLPVISGWLGRIRIAPAEGNGPIALIPNQKELKCRVQFGKLPGEIFAESDILYSSEPIIFKQRDL